MHWWRYPPQKRRQNWIAWCISFPSVLVVDTSINTKNITTIPYHFISTLLNANFDVDVSVANDIAIDVAKWALPGMVMQWSPCPELQTLTNENGRYIMKLNDLKISSNELKIKLPSIHWNISIKYLKIPLIYFKIFSIYRIIE